MLSKEDAKVKRMLSKEDAKNEDASNLKRLVHMLLVHQRPLWLQDPLRQIRDLYRDDNKLYIHLGLGAAALTLLSLLLYRVARALS
ncbi:hypothetical protein ACOMHN_044843 [Nucella lapillus]